MNLSAKAASANDDQIEHVLWMRIAPRRRQILDAGPAVNREDLPGYESTGVAQQKLNAGNDVADRS